MHGRAGHPIFDVCFNQSSLRLNCQWGLRCWSVEGKTWHMDICNYFLHELKDQGLLTVKHIPGDNNDEDIFMKNGMSVLFNKHKLLYVGNNKYLQEQNQASSREDCYMVIFALELAKE